MSNPVTFTPDNEPYVGLRSLFVFDVLIKSALELSGAVAQATRDQELTRLQRSARQIIPQGINLALSIRELIRQGYIFSAAVLLRSLVERAAIISYLWRVPDALDLWEDGWRHKVRPNLPEMLKMGDPQKDLESARKVCRTLDHLVHGDPMGADFNLISLGEQGLGYAVGRVVNHPELCDFVCDQAISWLSILCAMMGACFPGTAGSRPN